MKRILIVIALLLLTIPIMAYNQSVLYIGPYLQNIAPTSITIMWETKDSVLGSVEYGQNKKFDKNIKKKQPTKIHEIHLLSLTPDMVYDYRIRDDKQILKTASFKTAPTPNTQNNWRMVVYGDNRSHPDVHRKNVEQIIKIDPMIVLNTGDLVSKGTNYEQWKTQFFDPLQGLIEHVPIYTCLSNHERNADHYYNYMSLPDDNRESYYSFNYANAHIICLNSCQEDSQQVSWLLKDLEMNKNAKWKIVFFHHSLFSCQPGRGTHPARWIV